MTVKVNIGCNTVVPKLDRNDRFISTLAMNRWGTCDGKMAKLSSEFLKVTHAKAVLSIPNL